MQLISNEALGEKYYRIDHKSGLTIYVMPKEKISSTYALFGTNYGSVDNCFSVDSQAPVTVPEGIAHFLEHKLFESEELDAFERYAKTGASANAYTSFDKTCYLFSCTGKVYESLEILLDFVTHPYFTEETVQKEQGIIGQEVTMYRDEPDWEVFFNLLRGLYHNNPVRIDIGGTVESIAQINADLLYRCYNSFYVPQNMVLAVVGNVDPEKVNELVDRFIETKETPAVEKIVPQEPDTVVTDYTEEKMNVEIQKFNLGFRENADNNGDRKTPVLMNMALNLICGKTTDFYQNLLNKGLINQNFDTEYFAGRGFAATIFGGESNAPREVTAEIIDRIEQLKATGVDKDEFEALKRRVYGSKVKSFNDIDSLAGAFVSNHFDYGDGNIFSNLEIYREITKDDIDTLIRNSFDTKKMCLSVIS